MTGIPLLTDRVAKPHAIRSVAALLESTNALASLDSEDIPEPVVPADSLVPADVVASAGPAATALSAVAELAGGVGLRSRANIDTIWPKG